MSALTMAIIATAIILLPVVLMFAFNGTNQSDSRGQRISRRWRARAKTPRGMSAGQGPTAS
jgi:hypothetical protein